MTNTPTMKDQHTEARTNEIQHTSKEIVALLLLLLKIVTHHNFKMIYYKPTFLPSHAFLIPKLIFFFLNKGTV